MRKASVILPLLMLLAAALLILGCSDVPASSPRGLAAPDRTVTTQEASEDSTGPLSASERKALLAQGMKWGAKYRVELLALNPSVDTGADMQAATEADMKCTGNYPLTEGEAALSIVAAYDGLFKANGHSAWQFISDTNAFLRAMQKACES